MARRLLLISILIFLVPIVSSFSESIEVVFCDGEVSNFTKKIQFMSPNYPEPQTSQQTLCKLKINLTEEDFAIKLVVTCSPILSYFEGYFASWSNILKLDH